MAGKVAGHKGPAWASFYGRAGGPEWFGRMFVNIICGAAMSAVPLIGPLLAAPWMVSALAVTSRRLHDLNISAWVQLVPIGVGMAVLALHINAEENLMWFGSHERALAIENTVGGTWLVLYGIYYLFLIFLPGTRGPNVYGESDMMFV
jgi:uncharacterized membrane protein YhaH (DUF805 family)